jgi:hypothetical protein
MSIYYIDFFDGNDALDGLTPQTARKTQDTIDLNAGDTVLFKRGTLFRGRMKTVSGSENAPICYGAYGEGADPTFCASTDVSDSSAWILTDKENIWECVCDIKGDVGNFVLDGECKATFRWSEEELCEQGDFFDSRFADGEQRRRQFSKQKVLMNVQNI